MGMVHPKIKGGASLHQDFVHRAVDSTVNITVGEKTSNGVVIPTPKNFFVENCRTADDDCRTFLVVTNYRTFSDYTDGSYVKITLPVLGNVNITQRLPILCAIFPVESLALVSFELHPKYQGFIPVPAQFATASSDSTVQDTLVKSGEDVFVVGYYFHDTVKVTNGVYSGWDLGKHTRVPKMLPIQRLGRMNITADFYEENPGGGVFSSSNGYLQGITDSYIQNESKSSTLKLAIPITVLVDMLALLEPRGYNDKTVVVRTPLFGFCTRPVESGLLTIINEHIKKNKPNEDTIRNGVVVTKVLKNSAATNNFAVGDVITSVIMGETPYELKYEEGFVKVDWAIEPVPVFELLKRLPMNKPVTFNMWRIPGDGSTLNDFSYILNRNQGPYTGALKTIYEPFENIETYPLGTIDVEELRMNKLDISQTLTDESQAIIINSVSAIMAHIQDTMQDSHLIITGPALLPDITKEIKTNAFGYSLLKKIDDVGVSTIKDVREIYETLIRLNIHYFKITFWDIAGYHDAILPVLPPLPAKT
jgi:hypothetical protein